MEYKRLTSTEFRVTYHNLTEPVEVTVLGRVIGHYVPTEFGRYWEPAEENGDTDEVIDYDRVRVVPKEEKL
jgi:hypothetical protein